MNLVVGLSLLALGEFGLFACALTLDPPWLGLALPWFFAASKC